MRTLDMLASCQTLEAYDSLVRSLPLSSRDMNIQCRGGIPLEVWDDKRNSLVIKRFRAGILCRWASLWVGAHYSTYNRRWCINIVPCITIWVCLPGGKEPT